jgi:hypothetical protein
MLREVQGITIGILRCKVWVMVQSLTMRCKVCTAPYAHTQPCTHRHTETQAHTETKTHKHIHKQKTNAYKLSNAQQIVKHS